jgi:hypothetical protein
MVRWEKGGLWASKLQPWCLLLWWREGLEEEEDEVLVL